MLVEARRQAYLQSLGIPLWSARIVLPAALPAEPLQTLPWIEETVQEPTEVPAIPEPPLTVVAAPVTAPALDSTATAPRPLPQVDAVSRVPVAPSVEKKPETKGAEVRYALYAVPLQENRVALLSLQDEPDLSGAEHQLLANIHLAIGGDGAPVLGPLFRFPVVDNPRLGRDKEAACQAMTGLLLRYRDPKIRFIVFGDELLPYLEKVAARTLCVGGRLSQLLDSPALKRTLWQLLNA